MKIPTAARIALGGIATLVLAVLAALAFAWRAALPPVAPPEASDFDGTAVRRGAQLALLGSCRECHTSAGGESFAGGRAISTPFGTIYSTNITPDPETGIGHWSPAAFHRAMREGVDRAGRHLYPVFPYEHFTLIDDADVAALYAFMMTRRPVRARTVPNSLVFPANIRWLLAGWKLLYLREGPYQADPKHDARWNRGAYLAEGVAHCGACHTPRNRFGAEQRAERFAGADAEGWRAYAINAASQARVPWNATSLFEYLHNGWQSLHGDAYGPMAAVTNDLASVQDEDNRQIANYVAWAMGRTATQVDDGSTPGRPTTAAAPSDLPARDDPSAPERVGMLSEAGGAEAIYASACANCHDGTRALPFGGVPLYLSTAVTAESPTDLINVILDGLHPAGEAAGAIMPGFAAALSDAQLESLVAYLRGHFGGKPQWAALEASVRAARARTRD